MTWASEALSIRSMVFVIAFLMGAAMFATPGLLVIGIISFAVYGKFYRCHSSHLMRARCAAGHHPDILRVTHVRLFGQG